MKKVILILFFSLSILPFGYSQKEKTDVEVLTYLKEIEWPRAYQNQDTILLDIILAEEFQMIDAEGNWYTKTDELDYIKSHKPDYTSFKYEIKRLEVFENQTAIISGIGQFEAVDKEGAYTLTYHSSNILIKRDTLWKAISSHVSGVNKSYLSTLDKD